MEINVKIRYLIISSLLAIANTSNLIGADSKEAAASAAATYPVAIHNKHGYAVDGVPVGRHKYLLAKLNEVGVEQRAIKRALIGKTDAAGIAAKEKNAGIIKELRRLQGLAEHHGDIWSLNDQIEKFVKDPKPYSPKGCVVQ